MSLKRGTLLSLVFACMCLSKALLIRILHELLKNCLSKFGLSSVKLEHNYDRFTTGKSMIQPFTSVGVTVHIDWCMKYLKDGRTKPWEHNSTFKKTVNIQKLQLVLIIIYRRTVRDKATMREVILSNEELDIINRLQNYQFPSASYDPYEVKCEDLCINFMNIIIILLVTSKQKNSIKN